MHRLAHEGAPGLIGATIYLQMWYTVRVHKPFFVSGFLYHPSSQQILLETFTIGDDTKLVLFREKSRNGHDPQTVFHHCIEDALGVTFPASAIHPVYDYIHDKLGAHFIFYVEITSVTPKAYQSKNKTNWISLAKLSKCNMSEQTRHDIIVGERVIRSLLEAASPREVRRH